MSKSSLSKEIPHLSSPSSEKYAALLSTTLSPRLMTSTMELSICALLFSTWVSRQFCGSIGNRVDQWAVNSWGNSSFVLSRIWSVSNITISTLKTWNPAIYSWNTVMRMTARCKEIQVNGKTTVVDGKQVRSKIVGYGLKQVFLLAILVLTTKR